MTTDPGDLVLDPTCGTGTTAYVAEQWGRRWITIDTSRVPLALARQRLLTATFPYYELQDETAGPAAASSTSASRTRRARRSAASSRTSRSSRSRTTSRRPRKCSSTGRRSTARSPASPARSSSRRRSRRRSTSTATASRTPGVAEDALVRRPHARGAAPQPVAPARRQHDDHAEERPAAGEVADALGRSAARARRRSRSRSSSARRTAPSARSSSTRPRARRTLKQLRRSCSSSASRSSRTRARWSRRSTQLVGIPATYVQATPDLVMGDLLKTMRSSQIFSRRGPARRRDPQGRARGEGRPAALRGRAARPRHVRPDDDRGGPPRRRRRAALVPRHRLQRPLFHVSQVFFPRTSAWDNLKKALKTDFEESVWDHLAGTVSAPFKAGEHARDRGEGDRRPRQRAAGRQVARRGGMSRLRGRAADPQLAVRGAGRALADRGRAARRSARRAGGAAGYFYRDPKAPQPEAGPAGARRVAGARARQPDPRAARAVARRRATRA